MANPDNPAAGLTKIELAIALLILAGVLVFMFLQFSSPQSGHRIDEAYREITELYHSVANNIPDRSLNNADRPELSKTNRFGLIQDIIWSDDGSSWHLRYHVPTEAACNQLLSEISGTRRIASNAAVLPLENVTKLVCEFNVSDEPYLLIRLKPNGE